MNNPTDFERAQGRGDHATDRLDPAYIDAPAEDDWRCACGNQSHLDGFYPSLEDGTTVEPNVGGPWNEKLVVCATCGRIMDQTTWNGSRVTVVRGPGPVEVTY